MAFSFKPQQQLALDYQGNVAVSAGAGSGKTRVLVEKYFRLLADEHPDWPLDSVIAITFTVKAANELRQRIIKRVREELSQLDLPPARRTRLQEIRREIAGAPIGTIHNFCSRTLREFAFEARLNPDFSIVEGARESSMRREAVQQAMANAANAQGTREYGDLLALHAVYSPRQLAAMLESMLARRAEFAPACHRYATTDEDLIFEELVQFSAGLADSRKQQLQQELAQCLTALRKAAGPQGDEMAGQQIARLDALITDDTPWSEFVTLASELHTMLFTKTNTLRSSVEKSLRVSSHQDCVQQLLEACKSAIDAGTLEPGPDDRASISLAAMLARIFLRAEEHYGIARSASAAADEVDLLDFPDLELLAERLITSNANVRRRLRDRVRYLIVDEFQDTSELQWRILGPLVMRDDGQMLPRSFFMVGDPKQGVYGFRQASSRLFAHVRDLTIQSNPDDGCRGNISIAYNFRTLTNPLQSINRLFASLMDSSGSAHDVDFEALEPQRTDGEGETALLLAQAPDRQNGDNEVGDDEADLVAAEIAELLRASDSNSIAILLRKRKHFETYEMALRARGIAFVTHQGRGLYEQPEVLSLLALMRLLSNPFDDRSVLEVCRGMLFNFSDDLLLKIAMCRGQHYWEKCCAMSRGTMPSFDGEPISVTADDRLRLEQLTHCVGDLSKMVGYSEIHALLIRAIHLAGAYAIFANSERGVQANANVRRFVELTRDNASRDLDEFLAYIESEAYDGRGQGEATVQAPGSVVQIMTIHAAKGLEFDNVFLPELADPIRARSEDVMTDGHTWLALQKTLSAERPHLFLTDFLTEQKQQRAAGEEKRVLYVAMTRCRDRLYLGATEGGRGQENSFYGWIKPYLEQLRLQRRNPASILSHPASSKKLSQGPGQPVSLHDNKFTDRRAKFEQKLGMESLSTATGANIDLSSQLPFSPAPAVPAISHLRLDELLAAELSPQAAELYIHFRNAFGLGAKQLHRGGAIATASVRDYLDAVVPSAQLLPVLMSGLSRGFNYIAESPQRELYTAASTILVKKDGHLLELRADLEYSDSSQTSALLLAFTPELAAATARYADCYANFVERPMKMHILNVHTGEFSLYKPQPIESAMLLEAFSRHGEWPTRAIV